MAPRCFLKAWWMFCRANGRSFIPRLNHRRPDVDCFESFQTPLKCMALTTKIKITVTEKHKVWMFSKHPRSPHVHCHDKNTERKCLHHPLFISCNGPKYDYKNTNTQHLHNSLGGNSVTINYDWAIQMSDGLYYSMLSCGDIHFYIIFQIALLAWSWRH